MKLKIVLFFLVMQLFAQTFDFMSGNFKKIIRFDEIKFRDGVMADYKMSNILSSYQQSIEENLSVYVSIIGHSSENAEQNVSLQYAHTIKKFFLDNNISENIIFIESKEAKEPLYISNNEEFNHRVIVTLYVFELDQDFSKK